MNVIVSNEQQAVLSNLNIEIIKTVNGVYPAEEIIQLFSNFFFGNMIMDVTALEGYKDPRNLQKLSMALDVNKIILLLPNVHECKDPRYVSKLISMGYYNFTYDLDGVNYLLVNPNSYKDVAHLHALDDGVSVVASPGVTVVNNYSAPSGIVLGVKNVTPGAGSTTFIYLLKKRLTQLGISNVALEVDRRDFTFLNDKDLVSVTKENLANEVLKYRNVQVVLLDLNDYVDNGICTDVIYMFEPSYIKLNKLMMKDRNIFTKLKGQKVVLAKSMLSDNDVAELEYEAKMKFFYNLPPLNDRKDNNEVLDEFLSKFGLIAFK